MARLGGADELIVRAVEQRRHLLEARGVAVDQLLRRDAFLRGGLRDLDAVLVGAGEEEHVVAVEPLETRDRVGRDDLVAIADVRRAVRVRDRGRDVVAGLRRRIFLHAGWYQPRVAAASQPNTLNTNGFRSRL